MQIVINGDEIFTQKEVVIDKSGKAYISNQLAGKKVKIIVLKPKE